MIASDPIFTASVEEKPPWYIFGYGSLLSSASRIKSDCGLQGLQEDQIEWFLTNFNVDIAFNKEKAKCIKEKQRKQYIPCKVHGYRRGWYARGTLPQSDVPQNDLFIRPTYLGIVKDVGYNATGVVYRVTETELNKTDIRETGGDYVFSTLSKSDLTLYTDFNIPDNAKIRVYYSNRTRGPTKVYPVVQSYVDVFLGGAIEIEEKSPDAKEHNFALSTCQQTYGWNGEWLNDRPYPRHRAKYSSIRADKIDKLLHRCIQKNESNGSYINVLYDETVENYNPYSPLTSEVISNIKFPCSCESKISN